MHTLHRFALTAVCSAVHLLASAQQAPAAGSSRPAADDGGLQTIVITATKRLQGVREVPQTIEAFSQKMLEDMGAKDIADVVKATAGVELRATEPGRGGVAIRGIAELNIFNLTGGTGSATGLYLDEIPITSAGYFPEINAFDLERVEILKGPQGTLFGEGSLAGTVRLIANKPNLRSLGAALDVQGSKTGGGGNGHSANAMINLPLARDTAALRVTVYDREDPGYVATLLTSNNELVERTNSSRNRGGRLMLRLRPAPKHTVDVTFATADASRGGTNRATDDFIGRRSVLESGSDRMDIGNLTWQYEGSGMTVLGTVSRLTRDVRRITDQLGLVGLSNQLYPLFGLPRVSGVYAPQNLSTETTAAELRAVSTGAGPLKWTLGAFFKQHDFNFNLTSDAVPLVPPQAYVAISRALTGGLYSESSSIIADTTASTRQTALFGELNLDLGPAWQLQSGLRLFRETRESKTRYGGIILFVPAAFGGPITPPGEVTTSATDDIFNPRLALSYKPAPGTLAYATLSRGFRSGGQNDLFFSVPGSQASYAPERLTNQELGWKSEHFNRRLFVDVSAFRLDWKDLQAVIGEGPGGAGEVIGNIGKARSTGVDLALRARPTADLELRLGATLLDATTRQVVTLPDPSGTGTIVVPADSRIPRTAKQTLRLAATYRRALFGDVVGLAHLGVNRSSDSVSHLYRQADKVDGYTSVDLRLGAEAERWSAYLSVSNLTDAKIQLFRESFNDPVTNKPQTYWGRPRTTAINLSYRFD